MLIKEKKDRINRIINAGMMKEGVIVSNLMSNIESRKTSKHASQVPDEWGNEKLLPTLGP